MPNSVLYRNGAIYSPSHSLASAMLVEDGVIAWLGGEDAASSVAGPGVPHVDLDGLLVAPGFVDSHVHLTETGLSLSALDLRRSTSAHDVLEAVRKAAQASEAYEVIQGFGWDETTWTVSSLPSAEELDRASGGRPVYLARVDVHSALVSNSVLKAVGLDSADFSAGGDGYRSSAFVSEHRHVVAREFARRLSPTQRENLQRRALHHAAARGFVAVAEMAIAGLGGEDDLASACAIEDQGVDVLPYWAEPVDSIDAVRAVLERLHTRGIEPIGIGGDLTIDGSIGTRSAYLRDGYTDLPESRGELFMPREAAARHIAACASSGTQSAFHVIGDAAMDELIAALPLAAQLSSESLIRKAGVRFEHAEFTDDEAVKAMAHYGVIASMQPGFDATWGGESSLYAIRLGKERASRMNRLSALADAGVALAFGSDAPVTALDGWAGVRAALNHSRPDQRISARAAFLAHTRGGWRAVKAENPLAGQLTPGAPASFAIWEAEELMVQVANPSRGSFSTDARARTPMLPALDSATDPRCVRTVNHGEVTFDSEELN